MLRAFKYYVKSDYYVILRMTFVVVEFVITIFGAMEFVVINCFAFGEMAFGDLAIWRNVYTPNLVRVLWYSLSLVKLYVER